MPSPPNPEDLLPGTIVAVTQTGGQLRLDDGRELPFDITVCVREVVPGERVRVAVKRSFFTRRELAGYLEPADLGEPGPSLPTPERAIALLNGAGLARGLTPAFAQAWLDDVLSGEIEDDSLDDADLEDDDDSGDDGEAEEGDDALRLELFPSHFTGLLAAYYGRALGPGDDPEARAIADGWIHHDWRFGQETDDVVAELSARVAAGGRDAKPLLRQRRADGDVLHLADRDGEEWTLELDSLQDVVDAFNDALEESGDDRRFYALDTDGDWFAYLLLTPARARALEPLQLLDPEEFA